jgi:hypothetical protein
MGCRCESVESAVVSRVASLAGVQASSAEGPAAEPRPARSNLCHASYKHSLHSLGGEGEGGVSWAFLVGSHIGISGTAVSVGRAGSRADLVHLRGSYMTGTLPATVANAASMTICTESRRQTSPCTRRGRRRGSANDAGTRSLNRHRSHVGGWLAITVFPGGYGAITRARR